MTDIGFDEVALMLMLEMIKQLSPLQIFMHTLDMSRCITLDFWVWFKCFIPRYLDDDFMIKVGNASKLFDFFQVFLEETNTRKGCRKKNCI